MEWMEIIQLKSFTGPDRDNAIDAFLGLTPPLRQSGLYGIILYQSLNLDNELTIIIHWKSAPPKDGKSRLGIQLTAAFSNFGHIYHSAWQYNVHCKLQHWSPSNANQTAD